MEEIITAGRSFLENDIKANGYFYNYGRNSEGKVIGQKDGNENDDKGLEKDTFVNAKKLKIIYSDFGRVCNIVMHEVLSNEEDKYIWLTQIIMKERTQKRDITSLMNMIMLKLRKSYLINLL